MSTQPLRIHFAAQIIFIESGTCIINSSGCVKIFRLAMACKVIESDGMYLPNLIKFGSGATLE